MRRREERESNKLREEEKRIEEGNQERRGKLGEGRAK
jgi:hypothetical protein